MKQAISLFLPPLALMALTFFLSAQPNLDSGLGVWDTILRKGAHMCEFGLLAVLWYRALAGGLRSWEPLRLAAAAAIAVAYSVTDEVHQHFVTGRHASPVDVLIDAAGIVLAVLVIAKVLAPKRAAGTRHG